MYTHFNQVAVDSTVKGYSQCIVGVPADVQNEATGVELQADTANIRYTMDNSSNPSGSLPRGMILLTTEPPRKFLKEDIVRMRFTCASAAGLNIRWYGRPVS